MPASPGSTPSNVPLSGYCVRITKGTTPTTTGRRFVPFGVNFVKSEAITHNGRIDPSSFAFIDADTHFALARSILEEGDVLFSMAGVYLGKTAVVPKSILPANTNQAVGIIRIDHSRADPRFIHYALSSSETRSYVNRSVAQSAQPNYNLADIGSLRIPEFALSKQRSIADILGVLDDKIELNRRTNETLEAIARALFKSWFLDFDPVRAKAEGRQPSGMDAETAKLFPREFVDSELGPIPKGWSIGNISDVATNRRDTIHPSDVTPGSVYVGLEHLPRGRVLFEATGKPDNLESLKAQFSSGEVLFGKLRPYFKKVAIAPCGGICSTDILVLSPHAKNIAFVGLLAASDPFIEHAVGLSDGTRMPRMSWEQLTRFPVVIPGPELLHVFEGRCSPLFERAEAPRRESGALAALRDELLPRLLSGELSVADTESVVESQL